MRTAIVIGAGTAGPVAVIALQRAASSAHHLDARVAPGLPVGPR